MINAKMKSARGISLVSLVITTIVLILLANVIIYNVRDELRLGKLENMQNDIENLRDKISSYYAQNGKIPASLEYTNVNDIKNAGVISKEVDTGEFFVIDLSALENLTLNYGRDFEKVKDNSGDVNSYTDLYIINEASHNIFYVAGITVDNENYYTDYTADSVDTVSVDLRYVDGVKVPNGYSYVEGNKGTGIIIQNDTKDEIYTWVVVDETITKVPNDIVVDEDDKDEFLDSVNRFKGYYRNNSDDTVVYIEVNESWSPEYDTLGIYKDKNGDIAYIPEGFKVSNKTGETLIDEGLVVQGPDESEFVWIPVKNINDFHTIEGYYTDGNLQDILSECSEPYTEENSTELEEYNLMKQSVEKYHGFYLGRYETGKVDEQIVVKKDVVVYRDTKWGTSMTDISGGVVELAKKFASDKNYTSVASTLCYGVQWDAAMQFFDSNYRKGTSNSSSYVVNSIGKGNYSGILMNTGSDNAYSMKNIYDMAGNIWEWTMEAYSTNLRVARGGSYNDDGSKCTVSNRSEHELSNNLSNIGFRIALYLK